MICPRDCGVDLLMMERHGVEIDYCPKCRGVWLDRGELDKILERGAGAAVAAAPAAAPPTPGPHIPQAPLPPQQDPRYRRDWDDDDDDDDWKRRKKKRKGGWLDEIFDF